MKPEPQLVGAQRDEWLPSIFAGLLGGFLGLSLLKFGNPPITEKWVAAPAGFYEVLFSYPWPIGWAYGLLVLVGVAGIAVARWKSAAPWWLVVLPLVWLGWQFIAGTQSADAELTRVTLKHFAACVLCFYLGCFSLSRVQRVWPFWAGLLGGFLLVLAAGWEQRFGGLEASRRYFFLYVYPNVKEVPPEYLKKITSSRIFATLFYPNALAGALLLLLPAMLVAVWRAGTELSERWGVITIASITVITALTLGQRGVLTDIAAGCHKALGNQGLVVAVLLVLALLFTLPLVLAVTRRGSVKWQLAAAVVIGALACLYWSGSKAGWLLMLVLGLVGLLRLPFSWRLKTVLVIGILLAGLAGFFWKHSAFFQKGATSVSARFDYWRAAVQTVQDKPLFGTGPGTFAIAYQKVKRPESEMARLTHNDYLEQASDSGVVGLLAYTLFIVGALVWSFPRISATPSAEPEDWLRFAVWLGALGWSLQSVVEFGLYIPALAWPAFTFLGWLLGKGTPTASAPRSLITDPQPGTNPFDKARQTR